MPVELTQALLVTQSGSHVVLVFRTSILIFHVESGKKKALKHPRKISAVAIDPRSQTLAVGDEGGHITVLENALSEDGEKALPPRMLTQWHRGIVGGLIFDSTGNYLISAGNEVRFLVLVVFLCSLGYACLVGARFGQEGVFAPFGSRPYCWSLQLAALRLARALLRRQRSAAG